MSHLTKPDQYDISDTNIALLGSDLEKRVREHAGDHENAWENAGETVGLQIWRIDHFKVAPWPDEHKGTFYDGDSYIILNTYKKTSDSESLSYDLHFWLGKHTTQDEAGTAAYKTVELDDHLQGRPVQYREVQNHESSLFLSYFPRFVCLSGGVSTGFHHVTSAPEPDVLRLYKISLARTSASGSSNLVVREMPPVKESLRQGDVYVLDKGDKVWQLNTKSSAGKEKFKAAEFTRMLVDGERRGQCELTVYDEGVSGAGIFLAELGAETLLPEAPDSQRRQPSREGEEAEGDKLQPTLYRLSDDSGSVTFDSVEGPTSSSSLSPSDAFLLDARQQTNTIYVWIGSEASLRERRLAGEYALKFVDRDVSQEEDEERRGERRSVSIVKMKEGDESDEFLKIIGV